MLTGLAQLVAEELECDWARVSTEFASPNEHVKRKRIWGSMSTGGSAGIRTFPLVAVACCGFIMAAESVVMDAPEAMARVVEGLITGMGFIGGGAILKVKNSVKAMPVGIIPMDM